VKFQKSKLSVALAFACACCSDYSADRLVDRTRRAATTDQWRTWATQVIERDKTNSTPLPPSDWPEFVRRTVTKDRPSWEVDIRHVDGNTNSPKLVMLVAFGGLQSIGLIIGPPSYVEVPPPQYPHKSKQSYPGIYVREVD
jgi:hypothetical protein